MILGKVLRVFAATLVFTSSISFATGEGTGTNIPPSAAVTSQLPPPLVLPTAELTVPLPYGTTQVLSVSSTTTFTETESIQAQEYVEAEIEKNIQEGGHPTILDVNPDGVSREWTAKAVAAVPTAAVTTSEKTLPKIWNDRANGILAKTLNQFRVDPDYKVRVKEFGAEYWHAMRTFYSKDGEGLSKFNINLSLIKVAANSGAPCLFAILSHGFHNVAPQVAFLPYLLMGLTSGVVFTYFKTFIPWNIDLPKPSDTKFWNGVELVVIGLLYQLTDVGFIGVFRGTQDISNRWALSRGETPQFKIMTGSEANVVAFKSSFGQEPYDVSYGHIYKMGIKEQNALLEAHPELVDRVQTEKRKLNNYLGVRNVAVSVLINLVGLAFSPHSFISKVGFISMYAGAVMVVNRTYLPGEFIKFMKSVDDYFFPRPKSLNDSIMEQCEGRLSLLNK